jgi:ferredoxin
LRKLSSKLPKAAGVNFRPGGGDILQTGRNRMAFTIKVNGTAHTVEVDGDTPLLWVLRDVLGMTGTKFGCGMALCGACTVHVDGGATRSCVTPIDSIGTSEVTTIEAIGSTLEGPRSRGLGWTGRSFSAAIASLARSCLLPRC